MCKTKATVTFFVSLLNMFMRVSDVMLSMPCHCTRAHVITIMLRVFTPSFASIQRPRQWAHNCRIPYYCRVQRKSFLQLKLTFTSPNIISTSPKNVLTSRLISQFFCNLNSSKKFTCPLGKLITKFTSPIAKSTSPGLSDTTFFARCIAEVYNCA